MGPVSRKSLSGTKTVEKNAALIPEGLYCYAGDYRCPYWRYEEHTGLVHCDFTGEAGVGSEPEDHEKALAHFGGDAEKLDKATPLFLLWDQVKECGENPGSLLEEVCFDAVLKGS